MLSELASCHKVVGVKQSMRAAREGRARKIFLACDADPAVYQALEALCAREGIAVSKQAAMAQLGQASGISVGASVVAVLRDD